MPKDDFLEAADLIDEPRRDLGNIPDELDPLPEQRRAAPEPEDEPDAEPAPEAEGEADADAAADEQSQATARLEALERELQFLRAGMQPQAAAPQAPPAYTAENILPVSLTPKDMESLGLPGDAAEQVNNMFRLAALAGKEAAKQELRAEYQQVTTTQQRAQQLRTQFYGQHPDLEPYAELVGAVASQVQAQYPQADPALLMPAVAQAARQRLAAWGVGQTKPAAPKRRRVRPAASDTPGGGGTRTNGRTKLNEQERHLMGLIGYAEGR